MSLTFLSLRSLPTALAVADQTAVVVRNPDGHFYNASLTQFASHLVGPLQQRVEQLETDPAPTVWPQLRTLQLSGLARGSVALDGTQDVTLPVDIEDQALSQAKVLGLEQDLFAIENKLDTHTHIVPITAAISAYYTDLPRGPSLATSTLETPAENGTVLTFNAGSDNVTQMSASSTSNRVFWRRFRDTDAGWHPWVEFWHSGNLDPNSISYEGHSHSRFDHDVVMGGDLVPDVDNVRNLGAPDRMWRDVYIGPGSLYINGQKVLEDTESGTIRVTADPGQNIAIQSRGTGDIELVPLDSGVIQLKGPVQFQAGELIRSSNGRALVFDDPIRFSIGTGFEGDVTIDTHRVHHAGNLKVDGDGLTMRENELNLKTGNGLRIGASRVVEVDSNVMARKITATVGDGMTRTFIVNHNLDTLNVSVTLRNLNTGDLEFALFRVLSPTTVEVTFEKVPTVNSYKVLVIG